MMTAIPTGIAGVGILRWSWSRKGRHTAANALGWLLLLLSVILGGVEAGAWGVAIVSLAAMGLAMVLLGWAAMRSQKNGGGKSGRRTNARGEAKQPLRVASRVFTFGIVAIGGLAASIAFAVAVRIGTTLAGWSEADANATALVIAPLVWGIIISVLLMQTSRRLQYCTLAIVTLPLIPALFSGS